MIAGDALHGSRLSPVAMLVQQLGSIEESARGRVVVFGVATSGDAVCRKRRVFQLSDGIEAAKLTNCH